MTLTPIEDVLTNISSIKSSTNSVFLTSRGSSGVINDRLDLILANLTHIAEHIEDLDDRITILEGA